MDIRTKPMKSFKDITRLHRDSDAKVLTLAEHIIVALPERIKNEADEMMVLGSPMTEPLNTETAGLNDSFMDPLLDSLPNAHFDEFNFDFTDHSYRYHEVSTPCSSLSPASSGPLQSPASYSILGHDPSVSSPSPPPSTKQLTEFLHASSNSQYPFEADFSKLTLTAPTARTVQTHSACQVFDNFNKQETENSPQPCVLPKETSPSGPLKRTYSQSTQNQAARKFSNLCDNPALNFRKNEPKELVHQRRGGVPSKLAVSRTTNRKE
ncbi:hypothetical protein EVAR_72970_1, partial [Eumeta japonica]